MYPQDVFANVLWSSCLALQVVAQRQCPQLAQRWMSHGVKKLLSPVKRVIVLDAVILHRFLRGSKYGKTWSLDGPVWSARCSMQAITAA